MLSWGSVIQDRKFVLQINQKVVDHLIQYSNFIIKKMHFFTRISLWCEEVVGFEVGATSPITALEQKLFPCCQWLSSSSFLAITACKYNRQKYLFTKLEKYNVLVESRSWRDWNSKFGPNCDLEVDNFSGKQELARSEFKIQKFNK